MVENASEKEIISFQLQVKIENNKIKIGEKRHVIWHKILGNYVYTLKIIPFIGTCLRETHIYEYTVCSKKK